MEGVLEIRDGCNTPEQLLRSLAFARYLKIYKEEFITDLTSREKNRDEAQHKAEMIRKITLRDITKILDANHFSPERAGTRALGRQVPGRRFSSLPEQELHAPGASAKRSG